MTFSIVATGLHEGRPALGVAAASKFLAVGALVPGAAAGIGAVATQSLANQAWRTEAVDLMRLGTRADEVADHLVADDERRDDRQLGVVDAAGGSRAFTGSICEPWAGHAVAQGISVQGNCLAGPAVVAGALVAAQAQGELADRLLAALVAGDAAGGDKRGRQSASLLIVAVDGGYDGSDTAVDLRVDDHAAPVSELARLLDLHRLYFGAPTAVRRLEGELAAEVDALVAATGAGTLRRWAELENYEMRWVDGGIDARVLAALRATG